MTNYLKFEMRDPAIVFEEKEARTCKGCAFRVTWTVGKELVEVCQCKKTTMKKCSNYREAE